MLPRLSGQWSVRCRRAGVREWAEVSRDEITAWGEGDEREHRDGREPRLAGCVCRVGVAPRIWVATSDLGVDSQIRKWKR